jgi:hypothetical protein
MGEEKKSKGIGYSRVLVGVLDAWDVVGSYR